MSTETGSAQPQPLFYVPPYPAVPPKTTSTPTQDCSKGKAAYVATAALLGVAAIAVSASNVIDDPRANAALALVGGALLEHSISALLPRERENTWKTNVAEYLPWTFLGLSQLELNVCGAEQRALLITITAISGAGIGAYANTLITSRRTEQDYDATLLSEATGDGEASQKKLLPNRSTSIFREDRFLSECVLPTSSKARICRSAAKAFVGVGLIAAGSIKEALPGFRLFRDYGYLLLGQAVGETANELYLRSLQGASRQAARTYGVAARIVYAAAHALPMAGIAGAGALRNYPFASAACNLVAGGLMGVSDSLKEVRFVHESVEGLYELNTPPPPQTKTKRVVNWALTTLGVAYLGFGLGGLEFNETLNVGKWGFTSVESQDRDALIVLGSVSVVSYVLAWWARRAFEKNKENPWLNRAFYSLGYASNFAALSFYLQEKQRIGDTALANSSRLQLITGLVANGSLAWAIGRSAAGMGKTAIQPKIADPFTFALLFDYLTARFTNQVPVCQ